LPDQKARNAYLKESKNKFRKEKNNTTNAITRETIQKLYDISQYEVNKLKKIFDAYSGVDRKLNFQEYIRLYGYMNQNLRGPKVIQIAEHAFHQGDVDNDGLINFDQFLITYALTKPYGAYNRSKLNSEQIQGQGYSKINNSYLPTSNLNDNSLRIFNNNFPLAIEYNQESDASKKSSYENFKNKQIYNQIQQNQVLSPLIKNMSDQNLYSKNY
jgi:Ca2+-binding EF-hand superfamily protein